MNFIQGVVCLQNILVWAVSVTCLVLANRTELTILQLVSSFYCIMFMQFFFSLSYFSLFWLGYLSKWKLNADDLSIYWDSLLILLYVAVLLFSLVSSFSLPVCLYPTLADGIIVKAAL